MTTNKHPIQPSLELQASLCHSAPNKNKGLGVIRDLWLINNAYSAGADQQLDECDDYVAEFTDWPTGSLTSAMRPKLNLKEQALQELDLLQKAFLIDSNVLGTIRRALKSFNE